MYSSIFSPEPNSTELRILQEFKDEKTLLILYNEKVQISFHKRNNLISWGSSDLNKTKQNKKITCSREAWQMPTEICRKAGESSAAQCLFHCKKSHTVKITRTKFKTKDKIVHSRVINMENSLPEVEDYKGWNTWRKNTLGILEYIEEIQIPRNWESIMEDAPCASALSPLKVSRQWNHWHYIRQSVCSFSSVGM